MKEGPGASHREDEEQKWQKFSDFERAISVLPDEIAVGIRQQPIEKLEQDIEREIDETSERSERRITRMADAINDLYDNMDGIVTPDSLSGMFSREYLEGQPHILSKEEALLAETALLWTRRSAEFPISLEFSEQKMLDELEAKISADTQAFEERIKSLREKLDQMDQKLKRLTPRAAERLKHSPAYYMLQDEYRRENDAYTSASSSDQWKKNWLFRKRDRELYNKSTVNERMPYLSGEEYWEVQMSVLDHIIRDLARRLRQADKESPAEIRKRIEDALLKWAFDHGEEQPLVVAKRARPEPLPAQKIFVGGEPVTISPYMQKLIDKLRELYPMLAHPINKDVAVNLQDAQIVYNFLLRLIRKQRGK